MNHESIKENLLAFRDPEMPEEERCEIAPHIPLCGECREILKRWEMISVSLANTAFAKPSESFVNNLMHRLGTAKEVGAPTVHRRSLPHWLVPALMYGFAFFLMFEAIARQDTLTNTNTDEVLLAGVPEASHWAFSTEPPDMNNLVEVP